MNGSLKSQEQRISRSRRNSKHRPVEDVTPDVVRAARDGDLESFRVIVEAFDRIVFQAVHRLVGARYRNDVEDITQEVFLKLFRNLHMYEVDRGTKFSAWLLTIVRNHCYDVLKRKRVPTVSLQAMTDDEREAELPAESRGPLDRVGDLELAGRIGEAVEKLPRHQRSAFLLREYAGLSYLEIAAKMDCSEGTVKSRIHRAKEALRRLVPAPALVGSAA